MRRRRRGRAGARCGRAPRLRAAAAGRLAAAATREPALHLLEADEEILDRRGIRHRRHLHQRHLEDELWQRRPAHLLGAYLRHTEEPLQIIGRAHLRLPHRLLHLVVRQVREHRRVAEERGDGQIADLLHEITAEARHLVAVPVELLDGAQTRRRIAPQDGVRDAVEDRPVGDAERALHIRLRERLAAEDDHLIEERLRVAHAAVGLARDREERRIVGRDALVGDDALQACDQLGDRDALELVTLAARDDRLRQLVDLGRREDELHVLRRLLERLQQRVEGRRRQHVHLVDDVDLEARRRGTVADVLVQIADVLDAGVGGAVDLHDVERAPRRDLETARALPARLRRRPAPVRRLGRGGVEQRSGWQRTPERVEFLLIS